MDAAPMEQRVSSELAKVTHLFLPPALPEGSLLASAGTPTQQFTLSPISMKPGDAMSAGTAQARTTEDVMSPLADVVMGNASTYSRTSTAHQSVRVDGPPSPRSTAQQKTFSDGRKEVQNDRWKMQVERRKKRRLLHLLRLDRLSYRQKYQENRRAPMQVTS